METRGYNECSFLVCFSPAYQDYNSYWIGASDIGHEGEFRWADTSSFSYTSKLKNTRFVYDHGYWIQAKICCCKDIVLLENNLMETVFIFIRRRKNVVRSKVL